MKILDLSYATTDWTGSRALPPLAVSTDSSLVTDRRPLFPHRLDEGEKYMLRLVAGYRISRLGKTISRRFARRHYDAATLMAQAVPAAALDGTLPDGWVTAADFAAARGEWLPLSGAPQDITLTIGEQSFTVSMSDNLIDDAVGLLSSRFTLKNGDIIIPAPPLLTAPVSMDDHITAETDGMTILNFRIK